MAVNAAGRNIPNTIPGYGDVLPFRGYTKRLPKGNRVGKKNRAAFNTKTDKTLPNIKAAIKASGLESGMTVSFHHHLRNGDYVVNMVLDACYEMGIKDLVVFPTALFGVHKHLTKHIQKGVIKQIQGSVNGPIGQLASEGGMELPVVLRSHGGRPRAVMSGDVHIDVAFVAAPTADRYGNLTGAHGESACGSLGYAHTDADFAECVVAVTDNLVRYPAMDIQIQQTQVDYVVEVDKIGDPSGIVSGTTRVTRDPMRLLIARYAAHLIEASPYFKEGISFQTGAGGISLATAAYVREAMRERNIKGSFGLGGITSFFVDMLEEGLFDQILDVQSFDLAAVESISRNAKHVEISADWYANPWNAGCVVNMLDTVVLGATEVDRKFNANVNTEADGALLHGIGGHQDTASGAKLTIITTPLLRGRIPSVVDSVYTVTTPGEVVDAVVTEFGVAINPNRKDLIEAAKSDPEIPLVSIDDLVEKAEKLTGSMTPVEVEDRIIGVVEYRDGSVIDVVRQLKKK